LRNPPIQARLPRSALRAGRLSMRALRREASGLTGALTVHAALALWLVRPVTTVRVDEPVVGVDLELSPRTVEPEPPPNSAEHLAAAEATPRGLNVSESTRAVPGPATAPESAPSGSASAAPFAFSPTVRAALSDEALGLDGHNRFVGNLPDPGADQAVAPAPAAVNMAPGIKKSLRDAIQSRDHELGLDSGGPLVAVAEEVTRPSDAPSNGRAVFEITVDESGGVTAVRVVDVTEARSAWERVAEHLGATLRSRRIVVRNHAKGLVVTLEVSSRWVTPSGSNAGGAPTLGRFLSDGEQLHFDVTDIGSRPLRDVHARVLSERQL
jgi:hypothetical protein